MANKPYNEDDFNTGVGGQLDIDPLAIDDSQSLRDDLCADSLDIVELSLWVEEEFDITVEDEEMEKVVTVFDFKELIKRLIAEEN